MLVHRTAGRLHHEYIRAAYVLLNLNVTLAVAEPNHLRLPALHAEKLADFIGEMFVRRAAEDLEFLVRTRTLLPLRLLVGHRWSLLFNLLSLVGRRD